MKSLIGLLVFLSAVPVLAASPGDPAPMFTAKDQDGNLVKMADFKGKPVLIYFYPKDDTPGCTREACEFRDQYSRFEKLGAVVLGVSRQGASSHQKFRAKHKIPFPLLVDSDGAIGKAFGVKTMPIVGFFKRQSVLVGPDGKIAKFYPSVDPDTHVPEVLKDLEALHAKAH